VSKTTLGDFREEFKTDKIYTQDSFMNAKSIRIRYGMAYASEILLQPLGARLTCRIGSKNP
jgi:hypothetical protein